MLLTPGPTNALLAVGGAAMMRAKVVPPHLIPRAGTIVLASFALMMQWGLPR